MRRIGILGVGLLGSAVASRLLARGFTVTGYDPRREQLDALAATGLVAAGDPAAVVTGADAVLTILTTPDVVETVWLAPGGLLDMAPPTAALLQVSTISPGLARRLGEAAQKRGLALSRHTHQRHQHGRGPGRGHHLRGRRAWPGRHVSARVRRDRREDRARRAGGSRLGGQARGQPRGRDQCHRAGGGTRARGQGRPCAR